MVIMVSPDLAPSWDVDNIPRPVSALSASLVSRDWEHASHRHRKAQLLYSLRGVLKCEVDGGVWIVPPHCAVWIPSLSCNAATSGTS